MKKLIRLFTPVLALFVTSAPSFAVGLVTVSGTLKSMTETQYQVETANAIYTINRKAVPPSLARKITRTEIDVTFSVPFEAVMRVKSKPKG